MKLIKYTFITVLLAGTVCSCSDMLDTKLTNEWSEDDTWTNAEKAQGVLLSVYQDVMISPRREHYSGGRPPLLVRV